MSILLGRQSILDREQNVIAYELLFRSVDNTPINCDTEATASVISNILSMMSIDNILGTKRGFINIGIDILQKGLLDIIPPHRFVIEILETQQPSKELLSLIHQFKKKNYIFALDDFIINDEQIAHWTPILNEIQILKVDVLDTNKEDLIKKTKILKNFNVSLLAEKVETREMFDLCLELGYQYFQGYFFTKPDILKGEDLSPSIQGIISVIKKIQQDADINEIEQAIKLHPQLIISLLKIVNSSSVAPVQEITSIKQAVALLGKKAISQWLLLLLYSQKNANHQRTLSKDPLFLTAAQRGKLMECFLSLSNPKASKSRKDEAFLCGLLSLSDVLLHTSLEEVIKELHLSQTISDALLYQTGELGEYLTLVKTLESCNTENIRQQSECLTLTTDMLNQASHIALKFSQELAAQI